jgi:hypothetical protein
MGKTSKKRSRNSSKTDLTPPTKMATSTSQNTSQVLAQAHESLYNNHIALSASPVLPQHPPNTVPIISGTIPHYHHIRHRVHHRILAIVEEHHHNIEDRVRKLELGNRELENENIELRENFIKLQSFNEI